MSLDEGKKLFSNYSEAKSVADKMSRSYNQGFNVYKINDMWAIGGIHTKSIPQKKKVKSLNEIRFLLDEFKDSDDDTSVDDYINEVEGESLTSDSSIQGDTDNWILESADLKPGNKIGMSESNVKIYLVLILKNKNEKMILKMGGRFESHIPLIKKQAEKLIGNSVVWHTWNSKIRKTNWSSDSWFYLIEAKGE